MYLKRKVYQQLMDWKDKKDYSTLEVHGARQVGKTYIINKFANENYKHVIYINLFELSGKQFLECYKKATEWEPGMIRPEYPLKDAFSLYEPSFQDIPDTVIIIDEIQESAEIYNRIREFTRQFQCHFIVTGSYLGRVLEPEFRFSSGDVTSIHIYTLFYEEFLEAMNEELYKEYLNSDNTTITTELHNQLKEIYDIYCKIGGYPKVVTEYLTSRSIESSQGELVKIINTFLNESMRYFTEITDINILTTIFLSICRMLIRENKGLDKDSMSEELQSIVVHSYSSNISKETCYRAINWLYHSNIIGYCGKIIELDILDFKPGRRIFFMDLGITSYYLGRTGAKVSQVNGVIQENYVYINLLKRQEFPEEIAFEMPAFATYKSGEIDFLVQSLKSKKLYAIDVKSGKNVSITANKALASGKVNAILYIKGNTKGGIDGNIITIPVYRLEQFQFE